MSTDADRAAFRARQGAGARYDAAQAPVGDLLLARRGTAYFSRLLNGLPDRALVEKSRAEVVARVGYHARGLSRLMAAARTKMDVPEHESSAAQRAEITAGVSLPARALRGLFQHAAIHLDVEWRDLPGVAWDTGLRRLDGSRIIARDIPMIRAELIWQAALDLDAGGRPTDLPLALRRT